MSQKIKTICEDIINNCVLEFKKEHNVNKIKKEILDPSIKYIIDTLYPYILATCVIFVLTFLMATAILVLMVFNKNTITSPP